MKRMLLIVAIVVAFGFALTSASTTVEEQALRCGAESAERELCDPNPGEPCITLTVLDGDHCSSRDLGLSAGKEYINQWLRDPDNRRAVALIEVTDPETSATDRDRIMASFVELTDSDGSLLSFLPRDPAEAGRWPTRREIIQRGTRIVVLDSQGETGGAVSPGSPSDRRRNGTSEPTGGSRSSYDDSALIPDPETPGNRPQPYTQPVVGTNRADTIIVGPAEKILLDLPEVAVGIDARAGNDRVVNLGTIQVATDGQRATATGIVGGAGDDFILNGGSIDVDAVAFDDAPFFGFLPITATAEATGIQGGDGHDEITTSSGIDVAADATASALNLSLQEFLSSSATATAEATGIDGGAGDDVIRVFGTGNDNETSLTVTADASAEATTVLLNVVGVGLDLAPITAESTAVGVQGGEGSDEILIDGAIDVTATAASDVDSYEVSFVSFSPANIGNFANATAAGIEGGNGDDQITSNASITVHAASTASSDSFGLHREDLSNPIGNPFGWFLDVESQGTRAESAATGIDGGEGDDRITVSTLDVTADATANSLGVGVNFGFGLGAEGATTGTYASSVAAEDPNADDADSENNLASTRSVAKATGVLGGVGDDTIETTGIVTTRATSSTTADNYSVSISSKVPWVTATANDISSTAISTALSGGDGDDAVTVTEQVTSEADATTESLSVTLSLGLKGSPEPGDGESSSSSAAGDTEPAAEEGAEEDGLLDFLVNAASKADAQAVGVDGGGGNDTITTEAAVHASATSDVDVSSVAANFDLGASAISLTFADTGAESMSSAAGITGGEGADTMLLQGAVAADAVANASSTTVAVIVSADDGRWSASPTIAASTTSSTTTSTAVDGGEDDDSITIDLAQGDEIAATATSIVVADSVSADVSLKDGEFDATATFTDTSTTAAASAVGVDAGGGSDTLNVRGAVRADATVEVDSDAGALTFSAQDSVFSGAGLVSATEGTTSATAIQSGDGDDSITIDLADGEKITATAISTVETRNGAVDVVVNETALAGSVVITETSASATATGIDGGRGSDVLAVNSAVESVASATSSNFGVALTAVADETVLSGAVAVSATESDATVHAIDTGDGDDVITLDLESDEKITATANSVSDGFVVAAELDFAGSQIDAAVAVNETTSSASATGIDSGSGIDDLTLMGGVEAVATAESTGTSIVPTLSLDGAVMSAAVAVTPTTGAATATAIDAGDGDDTITVDLESDERVTATATSTAEGLGLSGVFDFGGSAITGAVSVTDTTSTATATGITSGTGIDILSIKGTVEVEATANSTGTSITPTISTGGGAVSAAVAVSPTAGFATATGVESGGGDDSITIELDSDEKISAMATADVDGVAIAGDFAFGGSAISAAVAVSDTTAKATAKGIDAGNGTNDLMVKGGVEAIATADANGIALSPVFSVGGAAMSASVADAPTDGDARATAVESGAGDDSITIELDSNEAISALATADVDGIAIAGDFAFGGSAISAAMAVSDTTANATAKGIDAGNGANDLMVKGTVQAEAVVDANGAVIAPTLSFGSTALSAAVAVSSTEGTATAKGVEGGDDNDTITVDLKSDQNIVATATSEADGVAVGLDLVLGDAAVNAAIAVSETTATSTATGIDLGAGADSLTLKGSVDADALADANGVAATLSVVGGAAGLSGAVAVTPTEGTATATAVDGGEGADTITVDLASDEKIKATAESDVDATSIAAEIAVGGSALDAAVAVTGATATATATGIDGGQGADTLGVYGDIEADSTANTNSQAIALTVTGYGAGAAAAVAVAPTDGTATACAIDGDAGDDTIVYEGTATATADSDVDGVSISAEVGIAGQGIGGALAITDVTGDALAVGIDGGTGNDSISNLGAITADSTADATGVAVSLSGAVGATVSYGEAATEATATSVGIAGGDGDDKSDQSDKYGITNAGSIDALAHAESDGVGVNVSLIGAAIDDGSSSSVARATGIAGGLGSDSVLNEGDILADATAEAGSVAVTATGLGASVNLAGTEAEAISTGIDGDQNGEGDASSDRIVNTGTIESRSDAIATTTGVSFSLVGAAVEDSSTTATARARGISGGMGSDDLQNDGEITVEAFADAGSVAVTLTGAGASVNDVGTKAEAIATGIDGDQNGEGDASDDRIVNTGTIESRSDAIATTTGVNFSLAGAAVEDSSTTATARARGLSGGMGSDELQNDGEITVEAFADAGGTAVSLSGLGASVNDASTKAKAFAIGIEGDPEDDETTAGRDRITNTGAITVEAEANASITEVNITVAGATVSNAAVDADARSVGIQGGDGDDDGGGEDDYGIVNTGTITSTATADSDSGGLSLSVAGASVDDGSTTALAESQGIDGGLGHDAILNEGTIEATADATVESAGVSLSVAGAVNDSSSITAGAFATGVNGDDGDDEIVNSGTINARSTAKAESDSLALTIAGAAPLDSVLDATADATGIAGGGGVDTVVNSGAIVADAIAESKVDGDATVIFGDSDASSLALPIATATGVSGGQESDSLTNASEGSITAIAYANAPASSSAVTIAGEAGGESTVSAEAKATGVDGGDGADAIRNEGFIEASAAADADASGSSWALAGSIPGGVGADVTADASSIGVAGGSGDDTIENLGRIRSIATSTTWATGDADTIFGGPDAEASLGAGTVATGVHGGEGYNVIDNTGVIEVEALTTTTLDADANSIIGGTYAKGDAHSVTSNAVGVDGGFGEIDFHNTGDGLETGLIDVLAKATVNVGAEADTIAGASEAIASGEADAFAVGVRADHGTIYNDGRIVVKAESRVSSAADASSYFDVSWDCEFVAGVPVWCSPDIDLGDATTRAFATAQATAVGIDVAVDESSIINFGSIDVTAVATASASADSTTLVPSEICDPFIGEFCFSTGLSSQTEERNPESSATAIGIRFGGDSGSIDNAGSITVSADASGGAAAETETELATAVGVEATGAGSYVVNNMGSIEVTATGGNASATGIKTGSGDDDIINAGTLMTTVNGVRAAGTAVDSGAGNDRVVLGAGSQTGGDLFLGQGDDALVLGSEALLMGTLSGGDGHDAIEVLDTGSHVVRTADDVESFAPNGGILHIVNDVKLQQESVVQATVNAVGRGGLLDVQGDGGLSLDGSLKIDPAAWTYTDGQTFDIVRADAGISGSFDEVVLPEPTAFLDFDFNEHTLEVGVSVTDFASAADDPLESEIADMLDAARAASDGDLAVVLGSFQLADATQVDSAFASFDPIPFDAFTRTTLAVNGFYEGALENRMNLSRATAGTPELWSESPESSLGNVSLDKLSGLWITGMGQTGDREISADASYDYRTSGAILGYDRPMKRTLIGGSLATLGSDLEVTGGQTDGKIRSLFGSVYGGYFNRRFFVQSSLSYSDHRYETARQLTIGPLQRAANGEHDGGALSLGVTSGFAMHTRRWEFEPFGALGYMLLDESGFEELDAASAGLSVASRNTRFLVSNVGLRVRGNYSNSNRRLIPELMIGWNHEFDLDDGQITSAILGVPDSLLTVETQGFGLEGAVLGAGLAYQGKSGWTIDLRLDSRIGEGYVSHGVIGGLRYGF